MARLETFTGEVARLLRACQDTAQPFLNTLLDLQGELDDMQEQADEDYNDQYENLHSQVVELIDAISDL